MKGIWERSMAWVPPLTSCVTLGSELTSLNLFTI